MRFNSHSFHKWVPSIANILTALGVLGGAYTFYEHTQDSEHVGINLQLLDSRSNGISFFISNTGGSEIAIQSIDLYIKALDKDVPISYDETFAYFSPHTSRILSSKQQYLAYAVVADPSRDKKGTVVTGPCDLRVHYLSSVTNKVHQSELNMQCIKADVLRQ